MSRSDQVDQLATALAAAQASMSPAHINKTNPHFKNRYADLSAVIEAVRQPLAANGLSFTQTIDGYYGPDNSRHQVLLTTLMHKSGQYVISSYELPSNAKPQEMGSALTYGRRYSLSSICGIAADEDDDGEATRKVGAKDDEGVVGRALAAVEAREARKGEKPQIKGPLDD